VQSTGFANAYRTLGEEVQKALGLGQVEVAATGEIESDVTIRLGKDWK
jgi:polyisoprenyl-teichoic acid--peptidoglycan teichoic acid transferase